MANKLIMKTTNRHLICSCCNALNRNAARFCGKCGQPLKTKEVIWQSFFPANFKRKLTIISAALFTITFFLTCLWLHFTRTSTENERLFNDIPVDHQVYFDCRKLLSIDGCRPASPGILAPEDLISTADVNRAALAVLRYYRQEPNHSYFTETSKQTSEQTRKLINSLAQRLNKEQAFSQIPSEKFNDLSKINIWIIIEEVFFNEEYSF
jgi:ribosomal protein L40E